MQYYLAVDIGASSGRHVLGCVKDGRIELEEMYRFENEAFVKDGTLQWDVDGLLGHIVAGMRACGQAGKAPCSMGIDTWGVDFVLLDGPGRRLGPAVCYRDKRTDGMDAEVEKAVPYAEMYAATGIQKQIFNTVYQLQGLKNSNPALLEKAEALLFMPDYFAYCLTGVKKQEYTEATTSALVNAAAKSWDMDIIGRLGFPQRLFGPLSTPGGEVGPLTAEIEKQVGYPCRVMLPATHDTGSAFLAVPAKNDSTVYISSGTWSLLGIETPVPIITGAGRDAGFTNEGGYRYRYRFLQNIMGLWMIQSVRRDTGKKHSYAEMERMARQEAGFESQVDVNRDVFFAPDSMTRAIADECARTGQPAPQNLGQTVQCVYKSLAACYARAIQNLEGITGKRFTHVNIVGGGTKDVYLNALTAQSSGLPVTAGPTEGTVVGNLMVQMIAGGEFAGLDDARQAVARSFEVKTYLPGDGQADG